MRTCHIRSQRSLGAPLNLWSYLVATIRLLNGLEWECDGEWDQEMNALT
jgi:hypothetical protein